MTKDNYNSMNVLEKVNYINEKLKEGLTLSVISSEIGISRKTIGKPFIAYGYIFNKSIKQYIKGEPYGYTTNVLPTIKPIANKSISTREYKPSINVFKSKEATDKILDIIDKHDNIQEMLEWYNHQKGIINVDLNELKIDNCKLQGKVKVTTVRVYDDVWEHFKSFMDTYKEFKSMDLISMAFIEYINKYEK